MPQCFAPPLTDKVLAGYAKIIAAQKKGPVKDAMKALYDCVENWWQLPESKREGPHIIVSVPTGKKTERGAVVRENKTIAVRPLEEEHKEKLDDLIPWEHELEAMKPLFDALPDGTDEVPELVKNPNGSTTIKTKAKVVDAEAHELKKCFTHLWWHVQELCNGREPMTQDILSK
jgi:hypothetical protein